MHHWLAQLDGLLRAHRAVGPAEPDSARSPRVPRRLLFTLVLLLGGTYGFFMGWYALRTHGAEGLRQLASSTIKLPLLFLFTLGVTFPSLYVFGVLTGSRLSFAQSVRVVGEWIVVILAVAASLGPILGFFTVSTESYAFIVLLNAVLLGTAGFAGCLSLQRRLFQAAFAPSAGDPSAHADLPIRPTNVLILTVWIVVFGVVGVQMGWVMRPFVGAPDQPFAIFRATESNGFAALLRVIGRVLWGG